MIENGNAHRNSFGGGNGSYHSPNHNGGVVIGSKPSVISREPMRFLVMDAPRQSNLHLYIRECRRQGVTDVVRVCEPTYDGRVDLENAGIQLHEMEYPDGTSPPKEVLERWLELVHQSYFRGNSGGGGGTNMSSNPSSSSLRSKDLLVSSSSSGGVGNNINVQNVGNVGSVTPLSDRTIAVHCVAGLGRAPVLVAIALVEFANMDPIEAVSFIRRHRRGAINEKQLNYLEKYKKQWRGGGVDTCCAGCALM